MQPTVKAALLCDYALTSDQQKLSILGIFSNINFGSLPNAYARFFVVFILSLDRGTYDVTLNIVDPVGQQVLPEPPAFPPVSVELPGSDTNLVVGFDNLVFNRQGIHQVQLFLDRRLIQSIPLSIQAVSSPAYPPVQA